MVTSGHPKFQEGKVYINEDQYFADVPEIAWTFYIGGNQPAYIGGYQPRKSG